MLDATVILSLWRRPQNLKPQIEALRNQTFPPKEIWLWANDHDDNADVDFDDLDVDRIIDCSYNFKFYGRFAIALFAETRFVTIIDDDTIPGSKWLENCLDTYFKLEKKGFTQPILSTAGITLNSLRYENHVRAGWPIQNKEIEQVDVGCQSWFFNRDCLSHLWREKPTRWDNGEDIQFSYCSQKYGGVQTFCPPHPPGEKEKWGSLYAVELGTDAVATSNNTWLSHAQFFDQRDKVVRNALEQGWQTVKKVSL